MNNEIEYLGEAWPEAESWGWNGPGWYFWDETGHCHGPHADGEGARLSLLAYAAYLNDGGCDG